MQLWKSVFSAAAVALLAGPALAGPVYDGKTVTLIVPNSPGGKMTQYARMIAPFIAKHLGAEELRIENQQGAGGLKGTNNLWHAEPDGMTIAFTNMPTLILAQLAGSPGVRFDATKFTYLGRAAAEPRVMTVGGKSDLKSIEDVRQLDRPFVYASQATDGDFYTMAVLADALGYELKIVTGYKGNADTALAVIKGDADGHMTGWIASKAAVAAGDKRVLLFVGRERFKELPDVPAVMELVKDPKKKEALDAIITIVEMSRGFFGPPDMDPAATEEMRAATTAALNDPELLAQAKKAELPIASEPGEKQQASVARIVAGSKSLTPIFKSALESIR